MPLSKTPLSKTPLSTRTGARTLGASFLLLVACSANAGATPSAGPFVFISSSGGIHVYRLDTKTGALRHQSTAADASASFLALHPSGRWLYGAGSGVSAFAISPETKALSALGSTSSGGGGACHLAVDPTGSCVLTAHYGDGTISAIRLEADGRLGKLTSLARHEGSSINPQRQEGPHAHSVNLDPKGTFAYAADLGIDKVMIYRFDSEAGTLTAAVPPSASVKPGAGPRHLSFTPSGHYAYVINELDSTVTAFHRTPSNGRLEEVQTISTLPADYDNENYPAEILVEPSGRFVYGSNRGHNSIVVFAIAADTGELTLVEHESTQGKWPRNFGIDPTGAFLVVGNAQTETVVVFRIDQETGELHATGEMARIKGASCIRFLATPGV